MFFYVECEVFKLLGKIFHKFAKENLLCLPTDGRKEMVLLPRITISQV